MLAPPLKLLGGPGPPAPPPLPTPMNVYAFLQQSDYNMLTYSTVLVDTAYWLSCRSYRNAINDKIILKKILCKPTVGKKIKL